MIDIATATLIASIVSGGMKGLSSIIGSKKARKLEKELEKAKLEEAKKQRQSQFLQGQMDRESSTEKDFRQGQRELSQGRATALQSIAQNIRLGG